MSSCSRKVRNRSSSPTCSSGVLRKNWYMVKGLVRLGSSQTVPDSVLPYLVPSAFTMSGVVKPQTSSPQTRRT